MKKLIGIFLLLSSWSAGAHGQEWRGGADLGIQITTRRGRAISNAQVTIVYKDEEPDAGPGPVATDSKGKAVFINIRAGLWQVEVMHDDYLSYVASVQIEYDKKPTVRASFLQAGGKSLVPMKAKFFKVKNEPASPTIGPPQVAQTAHPEPRLEPKPVQEKLEPQSTAPVTPVTPVTPVAPEIPAPPVKSAPLDLPTPASQSPADMPSESAVAASLPTQPEGQSLPSPVAESPRMDPPNAADSKIEPTVAIESESEIEAAPQVEIAKTQLPIGSTTKVELKAPTAPRQSAPVSPPQQIPESRVDPRPQSDVLREIPKTSTPAPPELDAPAVPPKDTIPTEVESVVGEDEGTVVPQATPTAPEPLVSPEFAALSKRLPPPGPIGSALRSSEQHTCPECRSHEWAVSSEQVTGVGAADSSCPDDLQAAAHQAMKFLATSINLELLSFAGPVADGSSYDAALRLEGEKQITFESLQGDYWNPLANCRVVAVVLPKASRFVGFRYDAVDGRASGTCLPATECEIGQSYWTDHPKILRGPSATIVYGLFVNQSRERRRRARLTAYFAPNSSEWVPTTAP